MASKHSSIRLVGATLLVLAMSVSSALADVYNVGSLPQASAYAQAVAHAGSFADVFNFHVASAVDVASSVSLLNLDLGTMAILRIENPVLSLFNNNDLVTPIATSTSGLFLPSLAAGDYQFHFTGAATGLSGGNYLFGLYSAVATPVPEPGQWGLMLSGLALLAGAVRRKIGVARIG